MRTIRTGLSWILVLALAGACDRQSPMEPEPEVLEPAAQPLASAGPSMCALTEDGQAYCWGMLPFDTREEVHLTPTPAAEGHGFVAISGGTGYYCGLTEEGEAYCWGHGKGGKLGDGTTVDRVDPVRAHADVPFMALSAGNWTTALDERGVIHYWGRMSADRDILESPVPAPLSARQGFARLPSSSTAHQCALTEDGKAYCWGLGAWGGLGHGSSASSISPVPVSGDHTFERIAVGGNHTCAIASAGEAYCWGDGFFGQLGHGERTDSKVPVAVATDQRFESIVAGTWHTCALTASGRAYCWGMGEDGQLGTDESRFAGWDEPHAVSGDLHFAVLSAGSTFTCGLTVAGRAYCWGENDVGQVGDGTRDGASCHRGSPCRWTPVPVATDLVFLTP